jgi:hypothetical protein
LKGLSRRFLFLLLSAGLVAGCELIAGIQDIAYSPDAGSGAMAMSGASSGSVEPGDDQGQTTGTSQSGTVEESGTLAEASPPMDEASSSGSIAPTSGATSGGSGSTGSTGSTGSSGSTAKDSGPDSTVEAASSGSGTMRDATPEAAGGICAPLSGTGTLPFVVDSVYAPTGLFGTGATTTNSMCTVTRVAAAKGMCHTATYAVTAGSAFAGVFWQDNFNWGSNGGYSIPPGATKITFSAMGGVGGEKVSFIAGYTGAATATTPCTDNIRGNTGVLTLGTTWATYTMTLNGPYPQGVLGAFGWEANAPGATGTSITFYIDNILYQ